MSPLNSGRWTIYTKFLTGSINIYFHEDEGFHFFKIET